MSVDEDINLLKKSVRKMRTRGEEDTELISIFEDYLADLKENRYTEYHIRQKVN